MKGTTVHNTGFFLATLINNDALIVLKGMASHSVDALVCDPPAGISFMSKDFDSFKNREHFIAELKEIFAECLRVMKPGAHGLVWALPRTSHWTATALEDAGFSIRDSILHVFGSGFPKSQDIGKMIDKIKGAEREVVGIGRKHGSSALGVMNDDSWKPSTEPMKITAPSSDQAKQWDGWGTALKPAYENWIMVRAPLSEPTIAKNVMKHGTGGINIEGSRVGVQPRTNKGVPSYQGKTGTFSGQGEIPTRSDKAAVGRFPANVVFSHSPGCVELGTKKVKSDSHHSWRKADGYFQKFTCEADCAIKELDAQSGVLTSGKLLTHHKRTGKLRLGTFEIRERTGEPCNFGGDSGGASRFFQNFEPDPMEGKSPFYYCAKASSKDRDSGLAKTDGNVNKHPCVKNTKLMAYLCRLITQPNGIILDPFMGSGSTGVAAIREGFQFIGIEKEPEYFAIAKARIEHETSLFQFKLAL